ncbi:MAG: thioredoxin domain-containing protein [Patescibacteria group bacterium]
MSFFVVGVLTVIIFIFFFLYTQPIPAPKIATSGSDIVTQKTPIVTFVNPSKGAANPKLTLVVYSDFECPACKQLDQSIDIALKTFPNDVRVVWKDMPNDSTHIQATPAAVAAHCADRQGKFWEYADELFHNQTLLSSSIYAQIASNVSLNAEKFSKCFASGDTLPIVKKDFAEGQALGIAATPTIFIGDQSIVGFQTPDELIGAIKKQLSLQPSPQTHVPSK